MVGDSSEFPILLGEIQAKTRANSFRHSDYEQENQEGCKCSKERDT